MEEEYNALIKQFYLLLEKCVDINTSEDLTPEEAIEKLNQLEIGAKQEIIIQKIKYLITQRINARRNNRIT